MRRYQPAWLLMIAGLFWLPGIISVSQATAIYQCFEVHRPRVTRVQDSKTLTTMKKIAKVNKARLKVRIIMI
jgi:hypothetical protein